MAIKNVLKQPEKNAQSGNHSIRTGKEKRILKYEDSLRDILDNSKCYNICIRCNLEREERKR